MKKIHIVFLGICLFYNGLFAQEKKDVKTKFDSIYFETAVNWAKNDYVKALAISDSLYLNSDLPLHKLKSLMLTASIYEQLGQQEESINYALKADEIASKIGDYDWQAKISGFLSSQYRNLGLIKSGKRSLEKGLRIIEKVPEEKKRNFYYGLAHQELAYYELEDKEYEKARALIEKSGTYFNRLKDSPNNFYYKATNEELFAKCDLAMGNTDRAEKHLDQALVYLDQSSLEESVLRGLVFSGKARVYKQRKDYKKALEYFDKAEKLALSSGYLGLKLEIYNELSDYYRTIGNSVKETEYKQKFDSLFQSDSKRNQSTLDGIVTHITQDNEKLENRQYLYLVAIGLLLFCVIAIAVFYKVKKKKNHIRFKEILNELKDATNRPVSFEESHIEDKATEIVLKEKVTISKTLESKILKLLELFESEQGYLDRNISASSLASKVDTNTKYLSIILKTHRNKDFNNYIGNLRIQYIMAKMVHHPEYRNYKISYLAEECGFSTHSKFTAVFKKHAGMTPSAFLENLNITQ